MVQEKKSSEKQAGKSKKINILIIIARYFNIIIVLLVIFVLLIGLLYVIRPKYISVTRGIEKSNKDKAEQKENMDTYLKRLKNYENQYNQISDEDRERINLMLPNYGLSEVLFSDMESLIKRRGLLLSSVSIKTEDDDNPNKKAKPGLRTGIKTVEVSLSINNVSYSNMKDLLATIEHNLHSIDIRTISYDPGARQFVIDMDVYYYDT